MPAYAIMSFFEVGVTDFEVKRSYALEKAFIALKVKIVHRIAKKRKKYCSNVKWQKMRSNFRLSGGRIRTIETSKAIICQ